MREQLREIAVVREDEQPLALAVEAADREDTWCRRNQLQHTGAPLRVIRGRHDPGGLVQQVVHQSRQDAYRCSVYFHEVRLDHHAPTENGYLAVDGDPSLGYELLTRPSTAIADTREYLLQPLAFPLVHSPGSARSTSSSISTVDTGGTNAPSGGRSSIESRPRRSRNIDVVPNKMDCPGPSSRPTACT